MNQPTNVYTVGPGGGFDTAELVDGLGTDATYEVTSLVVPQGDEKGAPTESQLAAAGTDYPTTIKVPYLQYQGAVGDETKQVTASIVASLPAAQRDPFHIAKAVQAFFLDNANGFHYNNERGRRSARPATSWTAS